jgi:putative phosphoesterase
VRVAVIADTHLPRGSRALPEACVDRLQRADLIVHAGDLTGLPFLEELLAFGPPVAAVHGNIDEPGVQALLPAERVVEAGEARLGIVHDAGPRPGREERLARRFPGCDAIVYGHTHLPQTDRHGEVWILNPGSPTERRRAPARTMLELVVTGGQLRPELVVLGA